MNISMIPKTPSPKKKPIRSSPTTSPGSPIKFTDIACTSTPEKPVSQPQPQPHQPSIFDHIWSITTDKDSIPVHDLFKLLRNLEIDLLQTTTNTRTGPADEFFLSNDMVIKTRIVEQCENLSKVNKQQALDIICRSLHDVQVMNPQTIDDPPPAPVVAVAGDQNGAHVIDDEDDYDYDETATLMETHQDSPMREDDNEVLTTSVINWAKPNIKLALQELEMMHDRLDKQYLLLEDELAMIKMKNDLDMNELDFLMKNNDIMTNRVGNIKEEMLELGNELGNYRDKLFSIDDDDNDKSDLSGIGVELRQRQNKSEEMVTIKIKKSVDSWTSEQTVTTTQQEDKDREDSTDDSLGSSIVIIEDERESFIDAKSNDITGDNKNEVELTGNSPASPEALVVVLIAWVIILFILS
ncbi:hypothetical protein G210_0517 [Candida maltosa Xu316]|uniref:Uncharacterized protein n=1 Tax=Candida maltosa (strain Xu316) TaxID=1245528 RepID=M3HMZ8_CANMX|nr:hypothetical protein G210_0517 [Candida maltosa Xu316]